MIVKYLSDNVWGYIDHVRQVATRELDPNELVNRYNEEIKDNAREDSASVMNGKRLDDEIAMSNKLFLMAMEELVDLTDGLDAHAENLIEVKLGAMMMPLWAVLLYIEDCKDYDAVVLITNQKCYLMNDEGKTIERLS